MTFVIGLFIGAIIGWFVCCLCTAAKRADEWEDAQERAIRKGGAA